MICSGWFDNELIRSSFSLGFLHGQWVLFCRFSEISMSILKNQTHFKVGHTSEFPFSIYWWTFQNKKKSEFWKNEKKKKKNCCRYHHFTHRYQKPQSLEVQFLRSGVRPNFLSFCAISCPFTPLSTRKIKILKKWKNHLEMSSFYTSAPKNTCLFWYGEWRQFLLFYPILNPNIKIWKNTWRYDMCVPQMKILMYGSWCIKFKKTKIFVLEILAFYNCVPQTTIRCSNCHFSFCTIYTSFTHWQ